MFEHLPSESASGRTYEECNKRSKIIVKVNHIWPRDFAHFFAHVNNKVTVWGQNLKGRIYVGSLSFMDNTLVFVPKALDQFLALWQLGRGREKPAHPPPLIAVEDGKMTIAGGG